MLTGAIAPSERGRMQGLNDLVVFGGVTMASFSSGGLMNCSGGTVQSGWQAVNMAMLPFLVLAGGALIWLALRQYEATDGHCGYVFPWNPGHLIPLYEGAGYHDFHHAKYQGN